MNTDNFLPSLHPLGRSLGPLPTSSSPFVVEMKAVTWTKDSHGLFDYESRCIDIKKVKTDSACKIYRDGNDIAILPYNERNIPAELAGNQLAAVVSPASHPQDFFIDPTKANGNNSDVFLIVRSLKNKEGVQKGVGIDTGDILKLGRMEYKVIESRIQNDGPSQRCSDSEDVARDIPYEDDCNANSLIPAESRKICRICLGDECGPGDSALMSPCNCKGSCEFVHWKCFTQWIENKVATKKSGAATSYFWKKMECEICNEPIPRRIKIGTLEFEVFGIERPAKPYLILESLTKEKKAAKVLHVLEMDGQEPIKLGRGHQCDVRISDISVSRLHAFIKFEARNGQFIITDNNSKFGTLVNLTTPFKLSQDKVAIQVGRTVVTFALKPTSPFQPQAQKLKKATSTRNDQQPFHQTAKMGLTAGMRKPLGEAELLRLRERELVLGGHLNFGGTYEDFENADGGEDVRGMFPALAMNTPPVQTRANHVMGQTAGDRGGNLVYWSANNYNFEEAPGLMVPVPKISTGTHLIAGQTNGLLMRPTKTNGLSQSQKYPMGITGPTYGLNTRLPTQHR
eukprot:TRINITY_DN3618_c0_g1_i1.p1 TRINITY_DN3618_c0_g1~~TRINITY_DN3618_c0_g1_i1.p1  ORF type:complete len:569 (+),score=120.59 TRINITY_DN3618_c0_g1_i1:173-1879(+)